MGVGKPNKVIGYMHAGRREREWSKNAMQCFGQVESQHLCGVCPAWMAGVYVAIIICYMRNELDQEFKYLRFDW
jgi:hypothetical protein